MTFLSGHVTVKMRFLDELGICGGFGILHDLQIFVVLFERSEYVFRESFRARQWDDNVCLENFTRNAADNVRSKFIKNETNVRKRESQSEVIGIDRLDAQRVCERNIFCFSRLRIRCHGG